MANKRIYPLFHGFLLSFDGGFLRSFGLIHTVRHGHPHGSRFTRSQGRDHDADLHPRHAEAGTRRTQPVGRLSRSRTPIHRQPASFPFGLGQDYPASACTVSHGRAWCSCGADHGGGDRERRNRAVKKLGLAETQRNCYSLRNQLFAAVESRRPEAAFISGRYKLLFNSGQKPQF